MPSAAAAVPKVLLLDKRVEVVSCSGTHETALVNAFENTNRLATDAADAAESGDAAKFQEYFRTTTTARRSTVAEVFRSLAEESTSTTAGDISYSCTDYAGICSQGNISMWPLFSSRDLVLVCVREHELVADNDGFLVAYAQPATGRMANCPLFYQLPALSTGCDEQSQASTILHEFTHVLAGTDDYAYGYARSTALSASQAINNADK